MTPPPVRVGYVLKMYPRFSETFILSEILELERQGAALHVFALKKPDEGRFHADVARVRAGVSYAPESLALPPRVLWDAHRRARRAAPAAYDALLRSALGKRRSGALKRFNQAVFLAPRVQAAGVTHLHAHFASSATTVAHLLHRLTGLPYSFTAHAKDIFRHAVDRGSLGRKLGAARFAVTVSDFNQRHLADLPGAERLVRIYNGLDLERFRAGGQAPDAVPLVLGVGRLVEKKGFDDLIRASACLSTDGVDHRCRIVGSGEEAARLAVLAEGLGAGHASLDGPLPREALLELYPRASVFAAPCVVGADGNRDGLPTVLIEAMALGVPVVATPVTGIPELVVHEETGLLVPERDPAALAAAIRRLLADRALAARLAAAARARVEAHFDLGRNVSALHRLFAGEVAA